MNSKSVKEGGIKSMYSKSKRFIASFLAVLMAVCMLPVDVLGGVGVVNAAESVAVTVTGDSLADGKTVVLHTESGTDVNISETSTVTLADDTTYTVVCNDENVDVEVKVTDNGNEITIGDAGFTATATTTAISVAITAKQTGGDKATLAPSMITVGGETVTGESAPYTTAYTAVYADEAVTPAVVVKVEGTALVENTDYEVTYADNNQVGTATVTVTPKADSDKLEGSAIVINFEITAAQTGGDKATLAPSMITVGGEAVTGESAPYTTAYTAAYADEAVTPAVVVTVEGTALVENTDYEVTYADNNQVGTATVTVTPKADSDKLEGSAITISFVITAKQGGKEPYPENWKVLDFSKVEVSTTAKAATYNDGYFTINAENSTSAGTVKSNKVTVTEDNMNKLGWTVGENTQNVYQTEGKGTAKTNTQRGIKFKVASDARVTVGAIAGGAGRKVGTQKTSENTDTIGNEVEVSTGNLGEYTFYLDGVTTETEYMIAAGASIMICYVVVEENYTISAPEAKPADGSKVNADAVVTLNAPDGKDISIYWAYGETAPVATDNKYAADDKYSESHQPTITEEHVKVTAVAVLENADGTVKKASEPKTFTYEITTEALPETINIAVPTADKDFGVYDAAQNVSLSSDTKASDNSAVEVDIYYTTDGTNPKTSSTANKYENAIPVNRTGVIKAYAKKDKASDDINTYVASDVATFRYIIKQSEEKTYVMNPADEPFFDLERSNYNPATPATFSVGDDYGVGTDDYFRLMYEGNNKAALRDMNVLTDPQKLGVTSSNYYTIANLTASWATVGLNTLVGELSLDTKAISICGGSMALAGDKVSNAVRIDASAPAKVTVYYSCKNPTTNGKIVVYNATTADDSTLATTSTNVTIDANSNPDTTNSTVGKAEITLAEAGSYYIGFSAQGGIIPYMSVTENPSGSGNEGKATITFMNGDATFKTEEVNKNEEFDISAIKPADVEGKVFKGWATSATATDVVKSITPTTNTVTLYAVWADLYTVTLKNGETTIENGVKTVEAGQSVELPVLDDTETQYFMGWKNADTTDTITHTGSFTPSGNTTLNAYFINKADAKIYIVTRDHGYKANETDVTNVMGEPLKIEYTTENETVTVTKAQLGIPERTGYDFTGWVTGTGDSAVPVPDLGLAVNGNVTVTATWTVKVTTYTVAFVGEDGTTAVTTSPVIASPVAAGTKITLPTTTTTKTDGSTFDGWKIGSSSKIYKPGDEYTVNGDVTFKEAWKSEGDEDGLVIKFANDVDSFTYTGSAIKPDIVVKNNGNVLTLGTDYTVKYSNNIKVSGKDAKKGPKVTVSGKGILAGKTDVLFEITAKDIDDEDVIKGEMVVVTGKKLPVPSIYYGSTKLVNKKDFTYDNTALTESGEITITGVGNFAGTGTEAATTKVKVTVVADAKAQKELIKKFKVSVDKDAAKALIYNGDSIKDKITAAIKVEPTKADSEFSADNYIIVFPKDTTNAGTVKFTVVGLASYAGCNVTKTCKILPMTVTGNVVLESESGDKTDKVVVSGVKDATEFNSTGATLPLDLTFNNNDLVVGKDYKVSYSNNKKAVDSKAKYTISFMGNYKGKYASPSTFNITKAELNKAVEGAKVYAPDKVAKKDGVYKSTPYVLINNVAVKASEYTFKFYVGDAEMSKTNPVRFEGEATSATVTVVITPKDNGNYTLGEGEALTGTYTVWKDAGDKTKDLSKAKIVFKDAADKKTSKVEYTGKEVVPAKIEVTIGGTPYTAGTADANAIFDYEVINNVEKGKATVIITPVDNSGYVGGKTATFSVVSTNLKTYPWPTATSLLDLFKK